MIKAYCFNCQETTDQIEITNNKTMCINCEGFNELGNCPECDKINTLGYNWTLEISVCENCNDKQDDRDCQDDLAYIES